VILADEGIASLHHDDRGGIIGDVEHDAVARAVDLGDLLAGSAVTQLCAQPALLPENLQAEAQRPTRELELGAPWADRGEEGEQQ
jgi:hypothetical protein